MYSLTTSVGERLLVEGSQRKRSLFHRLDPILLLAHLFVWQVAWAWMMAWSEWN